MSNPALWATSTAPRENSRNAGSTDSILGALHTIAVVIPVSATICGGMLRPGSTRVASSPSTTPPLTLTVYDKVAELSAEPAKLNLAPGSEATLVVKLKRLHGYRDDFALQLVPPSGLALTATTVTGDRYTSASRRTISPIVTLTECRRTSK